MKRELIVQGLAWGHMPEYLVADDLAAGRLESLEGSDMRGIGLPHDTLRRRDVVHGPVAQRLWAQLQEHAALADDTRHE